MSWVDFLSVGEAKGENGEKRNNGRGKYLVATSMPRHYLALSDIEGLGLGALIGVPWATERCRLRCVIAVECVRRPFNISSPPLVVSLFLCSCYRKSRAQLKTHTHRLQRSCKQSEGIANLAPITTFIVRFESETTTNCISRLKRGSAYISLEI